MDYLSEKTKFTGEIYIDAECRAMSSKRTILPKELPSSRLCLLSHLADCALKSAYRIACAGTITTEKSH